MTDDDLTHHGPEDKTEVVVQQISQLWYNNFGDVETEGDELDEEEMREIFMDIAQILNENDVEDLDVRQELVLEGIREAMDMLREKTVSEIEGQLEMYRHLFGI